jgi:ATP synthase protein I
MQPESSHGGEMSQDSIGPGLHPSPVTARAIDPAHRRGKGAYTALSASSVGLEMGLSVALGLLVGWWLDQHFGTAPWLMLLWLALGLFAGFRGVIRAVRRADRAAGIAAGKEASRG